MSLNRSVLAPLSTSRRARASIAPRPGVGLHAAAAPARAARAAALDDHVADLAGGAAAEPRLAVEDHAAADAGPPEHAEQRVDRACPRRARTRPRSPPGRRCRRAPWCRARSDRAAASSNGSFQPGRLRAFETVPASSSTSPGEPTPIPCSVAGSTPGGLRRAGHRVGHLLGDIGRSAVGRRRLARLAEHVVVAVDDDRLDLGAAEVDPAAQVAVLAHVDGGYPAAPAFKPAEVRPRTPGSPPARRSARRSGPRARPA